jgi:hypothetical protein
MIGCRQLKAQPRWVAWAIFFFEALKFSLQHEDPSTMFSALAICRSTQLLK